MALAVACGQPEEELALRPLRGIILISLDTVRADLLSAYGYETETTPFLEELATRSLVFENTVVQYPATLVSHMSMFTGLYPRQHGVYPPNHKLAAEIESLPEQLQAAGFRTAGFTEGGFMAGGYGFSRGFDVWDDPSHESDSDIERSFESGLDFLRGLEDGDRFFLFLHTYSAHDPYDPPADLLSDFGEPDPSSVELSAGENLRDFNLGRRSMPDHAATDFKTLYEASLRYVDGVVQELFAELESMGLAEETVVVLTSDHGEEFLEHGKLGHTQLYPESLFVPMILVHPDLAEGRSVQDLVQTIDFAPTLLELADVEAPDGLPGRSLVPYLRRSDYRDAVDAYAEVSDQESNRTLIRRDGGTTYQFLLVTPAADPDGVWVSRRVTFDLHEQQVAFRARSFHRPRSVAVQLDGVTVTRLAMGTDWEEFTVDLPGRQRRYRVTLEAEGCDVPAEVGEGDDGRCLSFIVQGPKIYRTELYDLSSDPLANLDISLRRSRVHRRMAQSLGELQWDEIAAADPGVLSAEQEEILRSLGYLD